MRLSTNGAAVATLLVTILYWFGVEIDIETMTDGVVALLTVVALGRAIWNQLDRGNVHNFFFKE